MYWCVILFVVGSVSRTFATEEDPNGIWNENHRLREQLLKNYDKNALPQKNSNGTTDVYVFLFPTALWIEDQEEVLVLNSFVSLDWIDNRLKWDYKDFGGLQQIHFGDHEIWKPDLSVYNNADITEIDHYGDVHFMAYSTGWVWWVPPARMKTYCPLDLKYWPFDEHTCKIRLGSWTATGLQINLKSFHNKTELNLDYYSNISSSWAVKKAIQRRIVHAIGDYKEYFIEINYWFTLQRRSSSFAYCMVTPAVVIPLLLLFQFLLPVNHNKRFTIGCCCAIFTLLELMFLKFQIPRLGSTTPLIVEYYSQCLILSVLTIGITALLGRLSHPQNPIVAYPPPELVKKLLTGPLATVLCIRENASKVGLSGKMEDTESLETSASQTYFHEWLLISKAADRVSVLVLSLVFFFSLIGYVAPIK